MRNEDHMSYNELFYDHLRDPEDVEVHKVINSRKIRNKRILKMIEDFSSVLHECFPEECALRFDENIKSLRVIDGRFFIFHDNEATGEYYSCKNTIIIYDYDSLIHELFHMASALITYYIKGKYNEFLGFRDKARGVGLNEGYTQLLAKRYFECRDSYDRLVNVTSKLEYIVSARTMVRLFFTTGLKGLAEELSQYTSVDDITLVSNFVENMDNIYYEKAPSNERDKEYVNVYDDIFQFYKYKLVKLVLNESITEEEAMDRYNSFISRLFDENTIDPLSINTKLFLDKEFVVSELATRASIQQYQVKKLIREGKSEKEKTRKIS